MGELKCCRCVRARLWAEPEIKMGVKTSSSYFIAICFKTFWWWWTLPALVMIHRSEASKVWMQMPESSQMRIIIRAILHLVWAWYLVKCSEIYLRGAGHLSQHDDEMNIALLNHRPEVVHCVGHRTLKSSFSEQWTVFSTWARSCCSEILSFLNRNLCCDVESLRISNSRRYVTGGGRDYQNDNNT